MSDKEKKPIEMLFSDDSLSELSEDFKTKASVIFESAVENQINEQRKVLEEEFSDRLDEEREVIESEYETKIDSYLTYVVDEWMKENKLAVEKGVQVEIAENFLTGMKDLFTESYVEIPENKVDVVAEMIEELSDKRNRISNLIDENITLKEQVKDTRRGVILAECTTGLADTQMEKLTDLVEMVDYNNDEQFKGRVSSIVESYFGKKYLIEDDDKDDDDDKDEDKDSKKKNPFEKKDKKDKKEKTDESMKRIVEAISMASKMN
jgi:hypothetical protein